MSRHSSLRWIAPLDKTVLFALSARILPGSAAVAGGGADLGGLPSASGNETAWCRVVRADNLNKLAPAGVTALVDYGVRTVIDLRDPRELEFPNPLAAAPPTGVAFLNVPLVSEANWDAVKDPAWAIEGYVLMARLSHANVARAIAAVSDSRRLAC